MLTDKDIADILGAPALSKEAAESIRTVVGAFADLLIEHQEALLDDPKPRA